MLPGGSAYPYGSIVPRRARLRPLDRLAIGLGGLVLAAERQVRQPVLLLDHPGAQLRRCPRHRRVELAGRRAPGLEGVGQLGHGRSFESRDKGDVKGRYGRVRRCLSVAIHSQPRSQ
jgi:hypothetical protein